MAPVISSISPTQGPTTGGTAVAITGSGFTGASSVKFGTASAAFTAVSSTQINATAPLGSGSVPVTVITPTGTSNSFTYTYVAAPVISSINPTQGPTAGGTTVTISGTGLAGTTAVTFGSVAALSFTTVSSTTVTAVAPSGTGTVSVTVTTAGGTSNSIAYAYLPAPVVSGISPSRGPLSGGTTVTLTGSNLTGATAVTFGSTPATSFTVVSATQITAVSPPSTAAGPATITVTTPGGTSAPGTVYFYIAAPVLTCASPGQGPVSGTNTVTLTGSGLTTTTAVTFGSTPATSFTVVSDTQLTVIAPHGAAGTVQLTVTTAGGTSDPIPYLYLPAPILTAISPGQGPVSGTNTITLTGSGLTTTTAVIFGTVPAAFTVISDSIITAVAPPGTAGPVNITVTTSAGTSPALTYTRVPPPEI